MKKRLTIAVVDGQGGGIGSTIIKQLRDALGEEIEIVCLGTNAMATGAMIKAGANKGASGENAIVRTIHSVDIITGSMAIVMANSMMGELTPAMAEAISSSEALKLLIPLRMADVEIVGMPREPLPHLVEKVVKRIQEVLEDISGIRDQSSIPKQE